MGNISKKFEQFIDKYKSIIIAVIPVLLFIILLTRIETDYLKIFSVVNLIQIILFYAIIIYSLETIFLRKANEENLKFEQRPCLVPYIRHMNDGNYYLKIKNVGKGTALNVSVEIIDPKKDYGGLLHGNVKYMPIGDERSVKFSGSKVDKSELRRFNKTNLYNQAEGFEIKITCKDASNNPMTPFQYEIKPEEGADWEIYTKNIGLN